MFWGLILEPGKRYSTVVDKSFHVSMATLDVATVKKDSEIAKVMMEAEEQEVLLCNLCKEKGILQQAMDLNFMSGDNITFECRGSATVHLTGYLVPDDFDIGGDEDEEGEESEQESDAEASPEDSLVPLQKNKAKPEKRKLDALVLQQGKKKKVEVEEVDSEEESDDEEEAEDEDEEEAEDEDEEDSDEEESDEDTPVPQQLTKQQKKQQNNLAQNKQQTPKKQNELNIVNGVTPNQQQSGKKDKTKVHTPHPASKNVTTPKTSPLNVNEPESLKKKRSIEGGVVVKDLKLGNGQVAKFGKTVNVYYTGKLKSNNKMFDSVLKGEGFKFKLGKGEVIKGWDIGINGMKVGGKRVVTCPANVAYGSKGSLPTIPPNSTLIFEVELKSVN